MREKIDGILLASGGMDSTVLAYDLLSKNKTIIPLFLKYGQHCVDKEYETLLKLIHSEYRDNIKVIDISDVYSQSNSRMIVEANLWEEKVDAEDLYLPYRTLLFLAIASAFSQSIYVEHVYSALFISNHAKEIDCSYEFFSKLESLLNEYGSVHIHMPYRNYSKLDVAKIGLKLGIPIAETYSCQVNSKNPCGVCPNCVDRLDALMALID